MTDEDKTTRAEELAIELLKKAARHWPESLWLFVANGTLCVMKKRDGNRAMAKDGIGVDPGFVLAEIPIECDGGDW